MYDSHWFLVYDIKNNHIKGLTKYNTTIVWPRTIILRYTMIFLFDTVIIIAFWSILKCMKTSKIAIKWTLTGNYLSYHHQNFSELSDMMLKAFPRQKPTETLSACLVIIVIKVTLKKSYNVVCRPNKVFCITKNFPVNVTSCFSWFRHGIFGA